MPIIGPIPKTKSTNFAEFFVWSNFWSIDFELALFFFDFFFFMKDILLQSNFKRFWGVIEFKKIFKLKLILDSKKTVLYNVKTIKQIWVQLRERKYVLTLDT